MEVKWPRSGINDKSFWGDILNIESRRLALVNENIKLSLSSQGFWYFHCNLSITKYLKECPVT